MAKDKSPRPLKEIIVSYLKTKIRKNDYDNAFFERQKNNSYESAKIIVPLVMDIFRPQSVVDVGCGVGAWLKVFQENGVEDFIGLDGKYVSGENLMIPENRFFAQDLSREFSLNRKFDLAISLEVAEHIKKRRARVFIKNLAGLSDIILFSAAIPHQGGTHHYNEEWPGYWRRMFVDLGYDWLDPFRAGIIHREEVQSYYRQNLFLVVKKELLGDARFSRLPRYNRFMIIDREIFRRANKLIRLRYLFSKYLWRGRWDI